MSDSLFTKIIQGEITSYKIHEDDLTFTFLNINQTNRGSILIIPKLQIDNFYDLPDADYQAIFHTAKLLSPVLKQAFGSARVGLVIEGFEVPHAHIKLFPLNTANDITNSNILMPSAEAMTEIQNKILEIL